MSHDILRVRFDDSGNVAVVTTRGRNTGTFDENPIEANEWTTDVFERHAGGWRCTLTQLTPVSPMTQPEVG